MLSLAPDEGDSRSDPRIAPRLGPANRRWPECRFGHYTDRRDQPTGGAAGGWPGPSTGVATWREATQRRLRAYRRGRPVVPEGLRYVRFRPRGGDQAAPTRRTAGISPPNRGPMGRPRPPALGGVSGPGTRRAGEGYPGRAGLHARA